MLAEEQDVALIAAIGRGDDRAFVSVVERFGPAMMRAATLITGNDALAADVFQDACVAVLRGATTYRASTGAVRPWLMSITRNTARRAMRQRREQLTRDGDDDLMTLGQRAGWGGDNPERALSDAERSDSIARAIAALPVDEREVLVLRDIEGLGGEETAVMLEISVAAMKSRLHRARLRLMGELRAIEEGIMSLDRNVGTLKCSEVLALLSDFVDGGLDAKFVHAVEEHVRGCQVCERFGGRFSRTVTNIRTGLGVPDAIDETIVTRLRDEHLRTK